MHQKSGTPVSPSRPKGSCVARSRHAMPSAVWAGLGWRLGSGRTRCRPDHARRPREALSPPKRIRSGASGGASIGGSIFQAGTGSLWTLGFTGAGQAIRRLDTADAPSNLSYDSATGKWIPATYTVAPNGYGGGYPLAWGVQESDWTKFTRSTSVTDNGGSGTFNPAFSGQPVPGNMQLNPTAVTVAGISYAPGTLGRIVDASSITGTGATLSVSKVVYAYDLRNVGAAQGAGGRDRNTNGVIDWNDVFDTVVTRQDFQTAAATTSTAFNMGRNFTFSADNGRDLYLNDSRAGYGGIWRVDLQGSGPSAPRSQ